MATKQGKGTVEVFDGQKLAKPLPYTFSYESHDSIEAAKAAGAWPNEAAILAGLNTDAERAGKAKSYQNAVKNFREVKSRTYAAQVSAFISQATTAGMKEDMARGLAGNIPELPRHKRAQELLDRMIAGEDVGEIDFTALDAE